MDKECNYNLFFPLPQVIKKHKLSKHWLRSLIDAREDQLERRYFPSINELEEYSEKSNSPLYYLILQGLGRWCAAKFNITLYSLVLSVNMNETESSHFILFYFINTQVNEYNKTKILAHSPSFIFQVRKTFMQTTQRATWGRQRESSRPWEALHIMLPRGECSFHRISWWV